MKKITTYLKSRNIRLQLGIYFLIVLLPVSIYLLRHPLFARADSYIKFNEGTGSTINDSKGSASGTIAGATWKQKSECMSGSCLFYDGNGDYVSFGDDSNFDFTASTNFTIEFWFRTTDITSGTRVIVSKYRGNDSEGGYKVYMSADGKINFGVDDDNSFDPDDIATSANAYDDNLWHHVVATKTGTTNITLYVDATLVGQDESISATGTLVNNDPLTVGIDSDLSSNPYTGYLDDLKIFITTARTSNQVITDYQVGSSLTGTATRFGPDTSSLSNDLIGYWKFDETSGNVINSTSNNNTLTNSNSTSYIAGIFGNGADLESSNNQYFSTTDKPSLSFTGDFSIAAWIKPESTTASTIYTIAAKWDGDAESYRFTQYGDELRFYLNSSSNYIETTTANLSTGTWYHVAASYSATSASLNLYINGVPQTTSITGAIPTAITDNTSDFYIGGDSGKNTINIKIAAGTDDAHEQDNNSGFNSTSSYVMVRSASGTARTNGAFRFANVDIPQGATITSAYLSAHNYGSYNSMDGYIYGEAIDNSPDFSTNADVTSRSRTSASVVWNTTLTTNDYTNSPNIASVIDEITDRAGWARNNAMTVIIKGDTSGTDLAYITSYESTTSDSEAILHVEYAGNAINNYDGLIDEARVYNRALSPIEVQQLYIWTPEPVGWWKMDEKTGTTIYDNSGNNNTGTFINSPTWTSGKYGNAIQFDGVNSYIAVSDSNSLDFTTNFTLSAWIKPDTVTPEWQNIFVKGPDANTTPARNYSFYLNYDEFYISWYNGGWRGISTTNANLVPGNWYYVVYTRDSSREYIYINGINVYDAAFTYDMIANNDEFQIGERYFVAAGGDVHPYQGVLDEVKFYNYVRNQAGIISDMNGDHPAPGSPIGSAILHYKLDEGNYTVANNSGNTGSSQNGTITNGTWSNSGKMGKAVTFSATTSITATISNPSYTNTLSLWVYPTTSAASKTLVTSGKLATNASSQPTYGSCTGTALSLNTWTHIVAVSENASSCKIYQNGAETASNTTGVTFGTSVNIGGSSFTGLIDEFKLYNFDLTATSVQAEFNQGKASVFGAISTESDSTTPSFSAARQYCVPGDTNTCNPPVAEWKFEEKTGQYTADISGNNLYMTLGYNSSVNSSDPDWGMGKFGNGLYFNGNDYAKTSDNAVLTPANDMTLTFWFKLNQYASSAGRYYYLINKAHDYTPYHSYQCYINSDTNALNCSWANSSSAYWTDAYTTFDPQLNQWYFVSFIKQGSNTQIRINNIPDSNGGYTNLTGTMLDSDGTFSIGANTGSYQSYLDGQLDEIKLYDYARTPAQISWEYNRGGPVGWWRLDECSGTTAHDTSGNGHDATITIGATGSNTTAGTCSSGTSTESWNNGTTGKFNSSLSFDGTNDTISAGNLSTYINSISVWIKPTSLTQSILALDSTHYLSISAGTVSATGFTSPTIYVNGQVANQVAINTWNHIVVTTATSLTTSAVTFGQVNSSYYSGLMDDIRLYDYSLTPVQIQNIINNSSAVSFGE